MERRSRPIQPLAVDGLTTSSTSFDIIDRHFLFKGVGREQTLSELQFMRSIFLRMKTVLDNRASVFGGPMW